MVQLFSASLKMVLRDKQSLFWALAFPIMFLGVFRLFSFDSFGTVDVTVSMDTPNHGTHQALVTALRDVEFLEITTTSGLTEADAAMMIDEGDTSAVILLTADGDRSRAALYHGINDLVQSSATVAGIASVVDNVNLALLAEQPPIEFLTTRVDAEGFSYFRFLGPGIIGMGIMNFATISLAGSLSRYREEGVMRRIRATPLAPWRFFSSVVAAHLAIAVLQVAVLMAVAEVLGASVISGGIPFVLTALFGTVIFLNIGVIVAGRVRGRGAVEGAANAITLPMMFLSGAFFPTDGMPQAVQWFVEILPLTHMLRAMRGFAEGGALVDQLPALALMAAWVAGTAIVARFSFSLRDA